MAYENSGRLISIQKPYEDVSSGIKYVLCISQPNLPERLLDHQISMHREVENNELSSSKMFGKVCLICLCIPKYEDEDEDEDEEWNDDWGDDSYEDLHDDCCIYIVDLDEDNSDEEIYKDVTIRCNILTELGVGCLCVLGNTLYMFEGHWSGDGTKVYTYEMPTPGTTGIKLDRSDLIETTPMNHPKLSGLATPTPNGKIVMLSTMVHFDDAFNRRRCIFELYDPCDKVWQKLPPLPRPCYKKSCCVIHSCTFLRKEVLLIYSEIGVFTLDLESLDKEFLWKIYNPPNPRAYYCINPSCIIIAENLCLTGWGTYELENSYSFRYPRPKGGLRAEHHVTLLKMIEERECYFCGVLTWVDKETRTPHLIISVYHLDYLKYNEADKDKVMVDEVLLPGATVLKSFKFHSIPLVNDDFGIIHLSSMSTRILT